MTIPNLDAALAMRHLPEHERNRLIAESLGKVIDIRCRYRRHKEEEKK